jgi:hypothetical protein
VCSEKITHQQDKTGSNNQAEEKFDHRSSNETESPRKIKYFRAPGHSEAATAWLLFRKFRFFLQRRFHIGQDEAGIKRRRTVDVPYTTFAIDEKDSENVIERTLRVVGFEGLYTA